MIPAGIEPLPDDEMDRLLYSDGLNTEQNMQNVLLQVGDNVTVTGYPFARQYNEEDRYEMINKAGFSRSIPEWLINLYNNSEILASEWQKLLDCCFKEEKVLIK